MIRVADVDGNGSIDDDDRIVIERDPKWISSFGTSLNIYGVDLALDFYVSHGGVVYNSYLTNWEQGGDLSGKRNGIKRDYWTPENPSNTTPAPNYTQVPAYITSLGYQDASYIRLRNLTIGYTLPLEISRKLFVQKLRVYFTANNLWTKTKVQSYSPEADTVKNDTGTMQALSENHAENDVAVLEQKQGNASYSIEQRIHTRNGTILFAVLFTNDIETAGERKFVQTAREFHGYWSDFGGGGYIFNSRQEAGNFAKTIIGKEKADLISPRQAILKNDDLTAAYTESKPPAMQGEQTLSDGNSSCM